MDEKKGSIIQTASDQKMKKSFQDSTRDKVQCILLGSTNQV